MPQTFFTLGPYFMKPVAWLVVFLSVWVFPSALRSENWPEFRGPGRQGLSAETQLPLNWSEKENLHWKKEIPGESWSTPIVWGEKLFLTTATDQGQSCRILCLDTKTGEILFNKEIFRQLPRKKEQRNSYATPTPVTDGERVYACFGDGSFAALNFAGEILWTNRGYPFYSQHGLGASPILSGDLLIMTFDGSSEGEDKLVGWQTPWDKSFMVALDAKTGKERWKTNKGSTRISHGTPVIWNPPEGKPQVVCEAGDVVQGYNRESGERVWTSEVLGEGKVPSTLIGDGFVFTSGGFRGKETIKAFKLGATGDLKESNLVWEQKKGTPKVPSMIYVAPYLFAISDNGIASCLHAKSGELVWQERIGGSFSASPVSAGGRIFCLDNKGETTIVEAGPVFKVLAKNKLEGQVQASIAIAHGRLYIRTDKHLFCVGSKKQ